jgi:predicted ATPase
MYIGPIRSVPERISDFSLLPENTGWAEGLAAWKYLFEKADDKFVDRINDWLSSDDKLNSGYLIKLSRYKEIDLTTSLDMNAAELEKLPEKRRILLVHKKSGLEVHPYDVGMGISQVLPIIIATLITEQNEAPQGGIVLIEQPELHIHPRLQVALGDMFTMQASNPYVNKLFLIETHSEHLMLRLLRRIRETTDNTLPMPSLTLVPDDVAVLYIENKPDGLTITNLEINNDGDFDNNWPNGFFDERSEELF